MKIKNIRIELGMTQEEFAQAVGVSVSTVSKWERDIFSPSRLASKVIDDLYIGVKK
jgi:DNA-binding transcriptional regulator YiaG